MKGKMYVFAIFIVFFYFLTSTILVQAGSLDNSYTVILHVHSPIARGAGVHIFDGSVIEARRISDGKRMGVKTADRNGRVIFKLPKGTYQFGPAQGLEKRLKGTLILMVASDLETSLKLTRR